MKNKVTVNIILQVYIIFEIIKLKKKKNQLSTDKNTKYRPTKGIMHVLYFQWENFFSEQMHLKCFRWISSMKINGNY